MNPVFFTDRDLGRQFPSILRAAGLTVEEHRDHFAHDVRDEEWLEQVGRRRWVALTHNARIRYMPNEVAAVRRYGVSLLVIVGKVRHSELASSFVATMPRILPFLAAHQPPFIAKVRRANPKDLARNPAASGQIEMWLDA